MKGISQIFKIFKRFAESQNVTKKIRFDNIEDKKISQIYFF